jgi:hypothetical protein
MGTTLTGTTPATTYDSLIKVTDNGPISGTLKKLTDGLGNDSSLSLSTTAASFSGNIDALGSLNGFAGATHNLLIDWSGASQFTTLTATDVFFGTNANERMRITSAGLVGIGTGTPTEKLDVIGGALAAGNGTIRTGITYSSLGLLGTFTNHDLGLITNGTEKARITAAGNVGIGTSSPAAKLDVNQTNQSGDNDFIRLTTDATSGSLSLGIYPSSGNSLSFIGSNALFSSGGVTRLNAGAGGSLLSMNTDSIAVYVSSGAANPVERMRIDSSGNVGIGETSPAQKLHVSSSETTAYAASSASLIQPDGGSNLLIQNTGESGFASLRFAALNASNAVGYFGFNNNTANVGGSFIFGQRTGATSYAEQMRITDTGNVGIGTDAPNTKLDVNGTINVRNNGYEFGRITTNNVSGVDGGLTFQYITGGVFTNGLLLDAGGVVSLTQGQIKFPATQVASADANTLDDYEEGTWTMGVSFGGASVGVTYSTNTGAYTKIGRQVTVTGYVNILAVGSSTGAARITGLPFTVGNTDSNYAGVAGTYNKISYVNQLQAFAERNTTTILLTELTEAGVETTINDTDFQVGSYAIISLTYFV